MPEIAELEHYHRLYSDQQVMRFIGPTSPGIEDTLAWVTRMINRWSEHGWGMYSLWLQESSTFIGRCGLAPLEDTGDVELAYTLLPEHWGRGYAAEAGKESLRYGFERAELDVIYACAEAENSASMRVMEKCGMKRIEPAFHYGRTLQKYSISRNEFSLLK